MIRLVLFSFFGLLLFASCQEVRKTEAIEKIDSHYASENLVHFTRTSSAMNRIEAYGILGNGISDSLQESELEWSGNLLALDALFKRSIPSNRRANQSQHILL